MTQLLWKSCGDANRELFNYRCNDLEVEKSASHEKCCEDKKLAYVLKDFISNFVRLFSLFQKTNKVERGDK